MNKNNKTGVLAALFLMLCLFVFHRAGADTLVPITDVYFHSGFEQQAFENLDRMEHNDVLRLYLMSDPAISDIEYETVNIAVRMLVKKYRSKKYGMVRGANRVNKITEDVKSELLKAYDKTGGLMPMLDLGRFQPVTTCMIYSLLFVELNIPFNIKQVGYYCWITTFFGNDSLVIETEETADDSSFFDERFIADYVRLLNEQKLIDEDEYLNNKADLLFDRYYRVPEIIDPAQLAAAQYLRLALVAAASNNLTEGNRLMEKAYLLHPHKENAYILVLMLNRLLGATNISSPAYASYLAKLMRFQHAGVSTGQLIIKFSDLTSRQLLIKGDAELYDASYHEIIEEVHDSALFAELSFLYHFERGRALVNSSNYDEAEPFIARAFELKPQSDEAKALFFGILLAKMEALKSGEEAYSFQNFENYFQTITDYKNRFQHLNSMPGFRKAWLFFCLALMDQSYQFNDAASGEKYRLIFENEYPIAVAGYGGINQGISEAYFIAAMFYKKSNKLQTAIAMVNKGLEYVPGSTQLLQLQHELK